MRFKAHEKRIVWIFLTLLALSCAGIVNSIALASAPDEKSAPQVFTDGFWNPFKMTSLPPATPPKKQKHKTAAKTVKPTVEKPEVPSPASLAGRVFNQIDNDIRLSSNDAERYTRIFALQEVGDYKKANETIENLEDHRLMGHVLFQRYTSRDYKSTYAELAEWMKAYADYPKAQKIYDLARKRKSTAALTAPRPARGMTGYHDYDSGQLAQPYIADQKNTPRERDLIKAIDQNASESPTSARNRLESTEAKKIFKSTKYDALQAQVAESYFHHNKVKEAYELAAASSDRSGKEVPLAGWIAGLAAWKQGQYDEAAKHFERTANSPRASAWMASAGAHWAARSYLRSHHPENVSYWLHRAAEYPRSFYGIISMKALGMEQARFNWKIPELNNRLTKALGQTPAGKRALALMAVGQASLAEQELRQINPGNDKTLQQAMMAFAHEAGVPAFEMRLGSALKDSDGNLYDAALYPDAPWKPKGGYQVDKALVYAFIRQESKFNADANNKGSGATGLMQLLPSTALNVARKNGLRIDKDQLQDPAINIRLGQKYLADLLQDENVKGNLFKLAVAYNAGPGKLSRWEKTVNYEDDPLLFIESIPVAETRIFVERVLTNYWIYRLKYNQNTDSLEKVASGEWPAYIAEDIQRIFSFADASDSLSH